MAPVSATGALETERSHMVRLGAGGGASDASTSRQTRDEKPRPPPFEADSDTSFAEGRPAAFGAFADRVDSMPKGWQSVKLDDIEPIAVVGGQLLWRPVRRTLDVGAFGINAYIAPKVGDDVVEEHTEETLEHEEVYVVLAGRATFALDEETLDAPAGTVVFVRDPKVRRHARAEEPGTAVLAIGGPRGGSYQPSAWEDFFAAERHRAAGDFDAYAAELEDALERRPDHPSTLYNLACAEALAGRREDAVAHLRRALELRPEMAEWARNDEDFISLRDQPGWPLNDS
jgi:tetratricopeptide (TPR) repeat protein